MRDYYGLKKVEKYFSADVFLPRAPIRHFWRKFLTQPPESEQDTKKPPRIFPPWRESCTVFWFFYILNP